MDPEMVGKSPQFLAETAGFNIPDGSRLLIAPIDGVGPEYPLSREILSPIVAYYTCRLDGCLQYMCRDTKFWWTGPYTGDPFHGP